MQITNTHGLPAAFYRATQIFVGEKPVPKRIRATQLIGPPQIRALMMQCWDELTEDCSERVWALFGSLAHALLERVAPENALSEERLQVEIDGWTVTGTADLYDGNGKITDYKTTSVYSVKDGEPRREWVEQLNVYAVLYNLLGFSVTTLEVCVICRDWSRTRRKSSQDYPAAPVFAISIPLWSEESGLSYVRSRLAAHAAAEAGDVLPCTDEERWATREVWAVHKGDNKRALKLHESKDEAYAHLAELDGKHRIEHRPREYTRCDSYCPVRERCAQRDRGEVKR